MKCWVIWFVERVPSDFPVFRTAHSYSDRLTFLVSSLYVHMWIVYDNPRMRQYWSFSTDAQWHIHSFIFNPHSPWRLVIVCLTNKPFKYTKREIHEYQLRVSGFTCDESMSIWKISGGVLNVMSSGMWQCVMRYSFIYVYRGRADHSGGAV
jgi:hypothetical protein